MKRLIVVFIICLLSTKIFARINVRANTFYGSDCLSESKEALFIWQFPISFDYEFSLEGLEADTFSFGLTGGLLMVPCTLINFSYIHCLQTNSSKNYRWNIESELHSGFFFTGSFSLNEEGGIDRNDEKYYPALITDVLFTFKPNTSGFYFGLGPVCTFIYISKENTTGNKLGWAIIPSLQLAVGYTF